MHRLQLLRGGATSVENVLTESFLEVDAAHEELRASHEESRVQQSMIAGLLKQQRTHGLWRERVSALLPVPAFVTDKAGLVLDANSVAAALLCVPEAWLLGKPLALFVDAGDKKSLKQVLRRMSKHTEQQLIVVLAPRHGAPVQVTLAGFTDPDGPSGEHQYQWVAVPTDRVAGGSGAERADACAAVFARLCRLAIEDDDPDQMLRQVAQLGRDVVPHATGISVSLGPPAAPEPVATESEFADAVTGAQLEAVEGPCVDAYLNGRLTSSHKVDSDPRWLIFAAKASAVGLGSAMAMPLQRGRETIGVVGFYAGEEEAFDSQDVHIAGLFAAAVAAVVQDIHERNALRKLGLQLEEALTSRAEIDQAKGIIMARQGCTAEEAFARMVTVSRNTNTKLADLAGRLVRSPKRTA